MESRFFYTAIDTEEGRQSLDKTLYFCQKFQSSIFVYIPVSDKFLMYFTHDIVQIELDKKQNNSKDLEKKIEKKIEKSGLFYDFFKPRFFTSSSLPDVPVNFNFMSLPIPRHLANKKIGFSFLGSRISRLMHSAFFSLFIPGENKTKWEKIVVFFGGNKNRNKSLDMALSLSEISGLPLSIITINENNKSYQFYEKYKREKMPLSVDWHLYKKNEYFDILKNSLIIMGANKRSFFKDLFLQSKLDNIIQNTTEDILLAGSNLKVFYHDK